MGEEKKIYICDCDCSCHYHMDDNGNILADGCPNAANLMCDECVENCDP